MYIVSDTYLLVDGKLNNLLFFFKKSNHKKEIILGEHSHSFKLKKKREERKITLDLCKIQAINQHPVTSFSLSFDFAFFCVNFTLNRTFLSVAIGSSRLFLITRDFCL